MESVALGFIVGIMAGAFLLSLFDYFLACKEYNEAIKEEQSHATKITDHHKYRRDVNEKNKVPAQFIDD